MFGIHTILHPTDFSEHSELAFRTACSLARDYGARLLVLHVAQAPVPLYMEGAVPPRTDELLDELRTQLLRLQPCDGTTVIHRLEEGNPVQEILRVAQAAQADLIVMGTHGRRGLRRLLMGSVAEQVMRNAGCPVMTVRSAIPGLTSVPAEREPAAAGA
jgi:nucleotide-binding universal stress UspA family protein